MTEVKMSVDFCGIPFQNPVTVASGTYGFGIEYNQFVDVSKIGGVMTKGLTMEPRRGNAGVRLQETPGGLLNCIGLENPGAEGFVIDYLPKMRAELPPCQIIANIAGATLEDYAHIAEYLDQAEGICAFEVNISCPNVKNGGMAFGTDAKMAAQVCRTVKAHTTKPVIMKLSPNVTDVVEIALALEEAGADALSLINTLLGMSIDIKTQKPALGNVMGGLSGPAVKPVGVRMVWQVAQKVHIPLIGMGGITTWQDAVEYMLAGASLITVGTANFVDPLAPLKIAEGIKHYCAERGFTDVSQLVGRAWK